jgi:hypothetical protein
MHPVDELDGHEAGERVPPRKAAATVVAQPRPDAAMAGFEDDAQAMGGEYVPADHAQGAVAHTLFDLPTSQDGTVTVVLPGDSLRHLPSQSLVRIVSRDPDGPERTYLGVVTQGPFAEPDGLRADSPVLVTVTIRGVLTPPYHGRAQVEILGEEVDDGGPDGGKVLMPPRFRPLPNSPAFPLTAEETRRVLKLVGDVVLGLAEGHEKLEVAFPSDRKSVLPRHLAVLGSTGGGKSTTVSGLIDKFQRAGIATVLLDVEGEYTGIHAATQDPTMLRLLERRGQEAHGVDRVRLLHLVGRETRDQDYPYRTAFTLSFDRLPPALIVEMLGMTEAQERRFRFAYDLTQAALQRAGIYPANEADRTALTGWDQNETGYPRLRLDHLMEIVGACAQHAETSNWPGTFRHPDFAARSGAVTQAFAAATQAPDNWSSWLALIGKLNALVRLAIFDQTNTGQPVAVLHEILRPMLEPGQVTIVDLSDTESAPVRNLVIAELLRGLQEAQDTEYLRAQKEKKPPPRTMVLIEEAHEFLAKGRKMDLLMEQVSRIAKRGRKRWLGLGFVSQLPQHLPDEVLALVNNFVLHKITDPDVIRRLRQTIPGVDEGLWRRVAGLAPGQAIASFTSMARPLTVAVDPTPCYLHMVE